MPPRINLPKDKLESFRDRFSAFLETVDVSILSEEEIEIALEFLLGARSSREIGEKIYRSKRSIDSQIASSVLKARAKTRNVYLAAIAIALLIGDSPLAPEKHSLRQDSECPRS